LIAPGIATNVATTSCLIVEDHDLTAEGILRAAQSAGLHPITRASTLADTLATNMPDVVLLDLGLPDSCRLDTVEAVLSHWPLARVLVLSADVAPDHAVMMLRRGVRGVINKDVTVEHLRRHINRVMEDRWAITSTIASALLQIESIPEDLEAILENINDDGDFDDVATLYGIEPAEAGTMLQALLHGPAVPELTPAQIRVLLLVDAGLANKAVANALNVRTKTVERHLREIRRRAHLPEREPRQLGLFAQRLHNGCLLTLDEHLSIFANLESNENVETHESVEGTKRR
jgi:DNA-binding NarL/FixJ family response regulator